MENIISEYQRWKQQGTAIRNEAKAAMETRFRELLTEAAALAEEYHADFGLALKPPPTIASFKYKPGAKGKPATKKKSAPAPKVEQTKPAANSAPNPKLAPLEKKLAAAKKKLDGAKAAGSPTRNLEDKIYEIEDEIRLASQ